MLLVEIISKTASIFQDIYPLHCTIKDYKQQAATDHLDALLLFFCRFYLRIFIDAARRSMNN